MRQTWYFKLLFKLFSTTFLYSFQGTCSLARFQTRNLSTDVSERFGFLHLDELFSKKTPSLSCSISFFPPLQTV